MLTKSATIIKIAVRKGSVSIQVENTPNVELEFEIEIPRCILRIPYENWVETNSLLKRIVGLPNGPNVASE